jgi:hypothetical protein
MLLGRKKELEKLREFVSEVVKKVEKLEGKIFEDRDATESVTTFSLGGEVDDILAGKVNLQQGFKRMRNYCNTGLKYFKELLESVEKLYITLKKALPSIEAKLKQLKIERELESAKLIEAFQYDPAFNRFGAVGLILNKIAEYLEWLDMAITEGNANLNSFKGVIQNIFKKLEELKGTRNYFIEIKKDLVQLEKELLEMEKKALF